MKVKKTINRMLPFLSIFLMFLMVAPVYKADAGESVESLTGSTVNFNTNEYHRVGTTVTINGTVEEDDITACNQPGVTCTNLVATPVTAEFECVGSASRPTTGGWDLKSDLSGQSCWSSLDTCFYVGTRNEICSNPQISGNLSQPGMYSFDFRSVVDDNVDCTPSSKQGCSIDYDDTPVINGNTDDPMFRLPKGSSGFFEYKKFASDSPFRLRYFERTGGGSDAIDKDMMVPSGPFSGTDAYSDYKNFLDKHPTFVTVEPACYPVDIDLCSGAAVSAPPQDGICGSAHNAALLSQPSEGTVDPDNSDVLCAQGIATSVNGSGPWTWSCSGLDGGQTASCETAPTFVAQCGSANGANYANAPTSGLCASPATATTVAGSGPNDSHWKWTCQGVPSPANDTTCSANRSRDAVCGPAHTQEFSVAADVNAAGLCNIGSAPTVSGPGDWSWTCQGEFGGQSADCTATKPACAPGPWSAEKLIADFDGWAGQACGHLNQRLQGMGNPPNCSNGNSIPTNKSTCITNVNYVGGGCSTSRGYQLYGRTRTACGPVDGICGPANGNQYADSGKATLAGLCTQTGAKATISGKGPWTWTCTGQGANAKPTSCSADVKTTTAKCLSDALHQPCDNCEYDDFSCPSGQVLRKRNNGAFLTSSPINWPDRLTNYECVNKDLCDPPPSPAVDGACGPANGKEYADASAATSAGLCAQTGTTPSISGSGPWSWTCTGQNGGSNSPSCGATQTAASSCTPEPQHEKCKGMGWEYNGSTWEEVPIPPSLKALGYTAPPTNFAKPTGGPRSEAAGTLLSPQPRASGSGDLITGVQVKSSTLVGCATQLPPGEGQCSSFGSTTFTFHPTDYKSMCAQGIPTLGYPEASRAATSYSESGATYWNPPNAGDIYNNPTRFNWTCSANDSSAPYNPHDYCNVERCETAPATQSHCQNVIKSQFGSSNTYYYQDQRPIGYGLGTPAKYTRSQVRPDSTFAGWNGFVARADGPATQISDPEGIYATGDFCHFWIDPPTVTATSTGYITKSCYVALNSDGTINNDPSKTYCIKDSVSLNTGGPI